jgi:hypothetical protein
MKKRVVPESSLKFPVCSLGESPKPRPSFTDEELFNFVGERGVFSDDVRYFMYCFREIVHRSGYILYRMKPTAEFSIVVETASGEKRTMLHDPMETFCTQESFLDKNEFDNIVIAETHSKETGEPEDVIETWCTVPFDEFSEFFDPHVSMDDFEARVEDYLEEQKLAKKKKKSKTEV